MSGTGTNVRYWHQCQVTAPILARELEDDSVVPVRVGICHVPPWPAPWQWALIPNSWLDVWWAGSSHCLLVWLIDCKCTQFSICFPDTWLGTSRDENMYCEVRNIKTIFLYDLSENRIILKVRLGCMCPTTKLLLSYKSRCWTRVQISNICPNPNTLYSMLVMSFFSDT